MCIVSNVIPWDVESLVADIVPTLGHSYLPANLDDINVSGRSRDKILLQETFDEIMDEEISEQCQLLQP